MLLGSGGRGDGGRLYQSAVCSTGSTVLYCTGLYWVYVYRPADAGSTDTRHRHGSESDPVMSARLLGLYLRQS